MRRDDIAGESEMMVWAWDVQTNARSQHTFIVKHARDRKDRVTRKNVRDPLIELRDIYENNANHGARRLREAIMAILPTWFVEEAKDTCWATLKKGDGKPLPLRISKAVEYFDQVHGVSIKRLETKVGRARSEWSEFDVAQLMVTAKTLDRRETTLDEAFPEENVPVNILPNGQPAMASPISVTHPIPIPGVAGFQPDYVIPASRLKVYDKDGNPLEEQPAETAAEPTESAEPHTPTDEAPPEAPAQDGEAGWPTVTKPGTGRKRS
jgi:hypothetical protein